MLSKAVLFFGILAIANQALSNECGRNTLPAVKRGNNSATLNVEIQFPAETGFVLISEGKTYAATTPDEVFKMGFDPKKGFCEIMLTTPGHEKRAGLKLSAGPLYHNGVFRFGSESNEVEVQLTNESFEMAGLNCNTCDLDATLGKIITINR